MSGQWLHNLDGVIAGEAELAQPGSIHCSSKRHGTGDEVSFLLLKATDLLYESLSRLLELGFLFFFFFPQPSTRTISQVRKLLFRGFPSKKA